MTTHEMISLIVEGVIACLGLYIASKAGDMTRSIDQLNTSVALLLERSMNQEKRLDRLEVK
jgi:hypothetical protein